MPDILVIDDDVAIREMLQQSLRREGHAVHTAANGVEALRLIDTREFQLVITDILMPQKEGIETIFQLRRDRPEIRIIAMSGGGRFSPETYLEMAKKIGANRTLQKPFSRDLLLETVRELLES